MFPWTVHSDCPAEDVLDKILSHAGEWTWDNCAWSDDNLSSKKIYPRFQFTGKGRRWPPRLKTCSESMDLLIDRVHNLHKKSAPCLRKKMDLASLEAMSERAAFVWNIALEVKGKIPIKDKVIQDEWLEPWKQALFLCSCQITCQSCDVGVIGDE